MSNLKQTTETNSLAHSSGLNKFTVARREGKPFRECSLSEIELSLNYCAKMVGYTKDLTGFEVGIIKETLCNTKGYFKITELKLAFECAVSGGLDLKDDDLKCFGEFSPFYVSKIITSFERTKGGYVEKIEPVEVVRTAEQKRNDKIQRLNWLVPEVIKDVGAKEKDGHSSSYYGLLYSELEDAGIEVVELEEKKIIFEQEMQSAKDNVGKYMGRGLKYEFNEFRSDAFPSKPFNTKMRNIVYQEVLRDCKIRAVTTFINICDFEGRDILKELLEKLG